MAEDKNIKDKKTKLDGAVASSKDAKQETSGIKKIVGKENLLQDPMTTKIQL